MAPDEISLEEAYQDGYSGRPKRAYTKEYTDRYEAGMRAWLEDTFKHAEDEEEEADEQTEEE